MALKTYFHFWAATYIHWVQFFHFKSVWFCQRLQLRVPGLPDGIFSDQKYQFGSILERLEKENVGIFFGHLEYFKASWFILSTFGNFVVFLVYFYPFR
jgi:hypothetical protein